MKAGELVQCRACPAMMRAAEMPSGSMNPLDISEIPLDEVLGGAEGEDFVEHVLHSLYERVGGGMGAHEAVKSAITMALLCGLLVEENDA